MVKTSIITILKKNYDLFNFFYCQRRGRQVKNKEGVNLMLRHQHI